MELNSDNYFSLEANKKYLSVSQYKSFLSCEGRTMANIKGIWKSEKSKDALIFGSLLHSWNEGEKAFLEFQQNNPELFSTRGKSKGQLKSQFKMVYDLIERIKNDDLFTKALAGEKEVIFTSNMFGIDWKICIDSYNPEKGYFTDLKSMQSLYERYWNSEFQIQQDFISYYKYDLQMIVYSEIERLATGRKKNLAPYLAVVTKETPPDAAIYKGFLTYKDVILEEVEQNVRRIIDLKAELAEPKHCWRCEYCRSIKETEIIDYIK